MSVAQWAPWVSVFLGGCLSGAALLSLSTEQAVDPQHAISLRAPPEPHESDAATEATEREEADTAAEHDAVVSPPTDTDAALAEASDGPSAADILAELERAYQRQLAASEATTAPSEPAAQEVSAAESEAEVLPEATALVAPTADDALALPETPAAEPRAPEIASDPATPDAYGAPEPIQVATAPRTRDESTTVQQVAVVYQPVYVLPPATHLSGQSHSASQRRSVGRDPWAPVTVGARHNPWATTVASGGAWATVGVAGGGVWAAGFMPRP